MNERWQKRNANTRKIISCGPLCAIFLIGVVSFPLRHPGMQRAAFVAEVVRTDDLSAATNYLLVRITKDERSSRIKNRRHA